MSKEVRIRVLLGSEPDPKSEARSFLGWGLFVLVGFLLLCLYCWVQDSADGTYEKNRQPKGGVVTHKKA